MSNISLDAVNKQYESTYTANPATKRRSGTPFSVTNYVNDRLADGEAKKTIRIRLLPFSAEEESPFHLIYMHSVRVDKSVASSGWKRFVCPVHNNLGDKCPYCELTKQAYEEADNASTSSEKEKYLKMAGDNKHRPFWIVRCIERGHESDGVKFWLFPHIPKTKDGIFDKIVSIANQRAESAKLRGKENDIFDLNNGKDLFIEITKDSKGRRNFKINDDDEKTPLAETQEQIDAWVNDEKKWEDVYTVKPYDYMRVVAEGGFPVYDKDAGTYIDKAERDKKNEIVKNAEMAENIANEKTVEEQNAKLTDFAAPKDSIDGIISDDLPF